MENAMRVLKSIYYMQDPKKITKEIKKNGVSGSELVDILIFLRKKGLVSYKNLDIPVEMGLTDKGVEFVVNELRTKRQEEFNKVIALTASILALIGIYEFLVNLEIIKKGDGVTWIFVVLAIIVIVPIVEFIIRSMKIWGK